MVQTNYLPRSVLYAFQQCKLPTEGLTQVSREVVAHVPDGTKYYVKVTTSEETVKRFKAEAESLRSLGIAAPGLVPKLYGLSSHEKETVMISEFFDLSHMTLKSERTLAHRLALMHDPANPASQSANRMYGFDISTYCGETEQDNHWEEDWMVFFRDRRLKSLLNRIHDAEIQKLGETLFDLVVPLLLENFQPAPTPVIIHGDLWSGNISLNNKTGEPVLYDPSSYYGHNEVELGIMKMFGGRSNDFFEEYHRHRPKSHPHHEERLRLYELYHHLNHTLIFGRGYRHGSIKIMKELINYAKDYSF